MPTRRYTLAVIAYLLLTFIIAAGWHLVLFKDVYDQLGMFTRREPLIHLGLISMLLQALVVAYLYPRFRRGGHPAVEGAVFGLLLGLFMASNAVLAEAGKNLVSSLSTWITLEGVYYLGQYTLVGIAVGLIYGRPRAT